MRSRALSPPPRKHRGTEGYRLHWDDDARDVCVAPLILRHVRMPDESSTIAKGTSQQNKARELSQGLAYEDAVVDLPTFLRAYLTLGDINNHTDLRYFDNPPSHKQASKQASNATINTMHRSQQSSFNANDAGVPMDDHRDRMVLVRKSRRRSRAALFAVSAVLVLTTTPQSTGGVEALAAPAVASRAAGKARSTSTSFAADELLIAAEHQQETAFASSRTMQSAPKTERRRGEQSPVRSYYDDDDDDEEDDDDEYDYDWQDGVSSFQQLQQSTGSDVLQADLQHQIELGAAGFLASQLVTDENSGSNNNNELEKLAVSSITEQLPQAAIKALLSKQQEQKVLVGNNNNNNNNKESKKYNDLNFAKKRVTAEQEIELARIIQAGVHLYKVKSQAEAAKGAELTRQEWAQAAGLKSTKQLRQAVVNYRRAKHDLVTANLGLLRTVVNQQYRPNQGVTKEELVQEGSLGLLRAAELFDPERGLRFSTYAVVWIKGVLQNSHVPELVRVPARERTKWNKICKAVKDHQEMNGTAPSVEELASLTGLSVQEVVDTQRRRNQAGSVLSLDQAHQLQSRSGTETANVESDLVDRANARHLQEEHADLAERTHLQADLIAAMARNLDAREARLMRLRYGLSDGVPRTLQECADSMGLSYARVHQLAKRCLQKLREAAEAESLEEYLLTIA